MSTHAATIAARVFVTTAVASSLFWVTGRADGASKSPPVKRPTTVSDAECIDVAGMVWIGDDDPYMIDAGGGSGCGQSD